MGICTPIYYVIPRAIQAQNHNTIFISSAVFVPLPLKIAPSDEEMWTSIVIVLLF